MRGEVEVDAEECNELGPIGGRPSVVTGAVLAHREERGETWRMDIYVVDGRPCLTGDTHEEHFGFVVLETEQNEEGAQALHRISVNRAPTLPALLCEALRHEIFQEPDINHIVQLFEVARAALAARIEAEVEDDVQRRAARLKGAALRAGVTS